MASTRQPENVENGKSNTKVPPGGASSNIFGNSSEADRKASKAVNDPVPAPAPAPATESPAPASKDETKKGLTAEPEVIAKPSTTTTENKGSGQQADTSEKKAQTGGRKGFNPITGQDYDDNNESTKRQRQQQPAKEDGGVPPPSQSKAAPAKAAPAAEAFVRARQPPGGNSSKLW